MCCLKSRIHSENRDIETFKVTVKLIKSKKMNNTEPAVIYESYQSGRKIYTFIYHTKKNIDLLITYEIEMPKVKIKKSYDLKDVFTNFFKGEIPENKKYLQKIDIN